MDTNYGPLLQKLLRYQPNLKRQVRKHHVWVYGLFTGGAIVYP